MSSESDRWSDDEDAHLRRRYIRDKASASIVGRRLGRTRDSVIGRAWRLGLHKGSQKPREALPYAQRPIKARTMPKPPSKPPRVILPPRKALPASPVPAEGVPLMQLGHSSCRWSIGTDGMGEHLFCGQVSEVDRPYCVRHCRAAYQPRKAA